MADPYVRQARGVKTVTIGSTAVVAGDALYFDGTDWELADADDATKFAEAFAVNSYASGEQGAVCRSCIIVDTDAPYTQGDNYYLSATAGAITATRPTVAGNLRQLLGFALSTSELAADIRYNEQTYDISPSGGTDVGVIFQLDSGNYLGLTTNAQNEVIGATFQVPENAVALEIAYAWLAAEASSGTPTFDLFVSSSNDGDQWDAVTQDSTIADSADEGAAADEIQRTTVTTAFDATNIWRPGALLGIRKLKKDSGTDITFQFGYDLVIAQV
jgi:hypothetical protein